MTYVTPENVIKTKTKINGINQNNCIFENSLTEKDETKITHETFKDMYLNTVNFNDTTEEDIKFLFKKDNKFILPDRLRKINYNRTSKDIKKMSLGFQFINNVDQQYKFMDENDLDIIITNDEDPDGYHVFISTKKWMKQKI